MKYYPTRIFTLKVLIVIMALVAGCSFFKQTQVGIGEEVEWSTLGGWNNDNHKEAWPALLNNCIALKTISHWQSICRDAEKLNQPDAEQVKLFFQQWFTPHRIYDKKGNINGLITGYYEPLLHGSPTQHGSYQYPIYRTPKKLMKTSLPGNKTPPFYTRKQIESDRSLLAGNELIWLDNRDDVFFLHVQGSGRVQMEDGQTIGISYASNNGHPYISIGHLLTQRKELKSQEISLFTIRNWLQNHPNQAEDLLNENPRYIFFSLRRNVSSGPTGSLNVPLTPQRSIAIDPRFVALGTPIWLQTYSPDHDPKKANQRLQKLVIAQDTGTAIKGGLRADLFWGHGKEAEIAAGNMKSPGTMIALIANKHKIMAKHNYQYCSSN